MITSSNRSFRCYPPFAEAPNLVSPGLEQVYRYLGQIEQKLFFLLEKPREDHIGKAPFALSQYASVLLNWHERSASFQAIRKSLLAGEKQATDFQNTEIESVVAEILNGKKVFEFGCRDGRFLKFCRDRGAIVAGMTDQRYFSFLEERLGTDLHLVKGFSSELSLEVASRIKSFQADHILSVNLFDNNRDLGFDKAERLRELFSAWAASAGPSSLFTLMPATDSFSRIGMEALAIFGVSTKCTHGNLNFRLANLEICSSSPMLGITAQTEENRHRIS